MFTATSIPVKIPLIFMSFSGKNHSHLYFLQFRVVKIKTAGISKTGNLFPPDSVQFRHFYRKRSGRRKPEKETGWQQQVSLWTWLFFSIKISQKVLHAQGFRQAHRYYPADDEICPRSERQVPAVSTASPWNQRNSFWISVSSATEYPSFGQMDSICLFGIPVFGFLSSKYQIFDNNWAIKQNFEQLA